MTPKHLAALLLFPALIVAPLAASAQDCADRAKLTCPEGQHWDEKTKSCVIPSS
ncbi:hypothetical protein C8J27_106121 [Rhodobacter aestuarii]|uniref:Chitin binding Peritrophin-A domain-containing protein n=1 Tax=Rhodobacter aestuarii TaxID=453582 RepID=A0A1N7M527_9RHOB|nr:hypothetical protein C8J27_106121 [Rhodobacter aestuarii]SIS81225.1 hypothetical protein SAMN05421580_105121 [Rhodobacter aestuarii]SOC14135.1 hypothetical protein SAMN05877809_10778 [Rhodobacter sp. JA431]